jgi:hypothetical protein
VVSNNTGNNQLVNGISLDFHFRGLIKVDNEISEKENLTINNDLTVCACTLSLNHFDRSFNMSIASSQGSN